MPVAKRQQMEWLNLRAPHCLGGPSPPTASWLRGTHTDQDGATKLHFLQFEQNANVPELEQGKMGEGFLMTFFFFFTKKKKKNV